ncbi:hypothetical protein TWF225_003214 [Orbilia oligospora]|uniref:Uncharacterized protein n=1 Tax=Orbilia oligospora TaxID=2813651 RepID=A0A7C8TYP0_ORBOL|nr:hypothetical protein TWF751_005991 [Orbilia oligospora]KAF3188833.1 hypothetical protein TWF225_003214 [Orbilia oligospora]KAF3263022.1 hypothetical protein TWF128_001996 [Orbilia oligospora]KAF3267394.1 hypothetical protein TWF217_000458 [Orbilia oligospora]KAF3294411.1 hypothetical protein TWF132_003397 [Orbilia oligospora]
MQQLFQGMRLLRLSYNNNSGYASTTLATKSLLQFLKERSPQTTIRIQSQLFSSSRLPSSNPPKNGKEAKLNPDKIKGPGGLTLTQIGKLVQDSAARDRAHHASEKSSGGIGSQSSKK